MRKCHLYGVPTCARRVRIQSGLGKGFFAAEIAHGTSVPYDVLENSSLRFLRRLDVEAGVNTPIVLAWGGAKTQAARHLRADGTPDMRFAENTNARLFTRGAHAGTWRIPATPTQGSF